MDVYRNTFAQFRMGVFLNNDHRHRFSSTARNKACPFCTGEIETEIDFLFQRSMYNQLRRRYLTDPANFRDTRSYFLGIINSESQQTILSVAKFLVCVFNLRTSEMVVGS